MDPATFKKWGSVFNLLSFLLSLTIIINLENAILQVEYIVGLGRVYGEGVLMGNDFLKSLFIYQIEN